MFGKMILVVSTVVQQLQLCNTYIISLLLECVLYVKQVFVSKGYIQETLLQLLATCHEWLNAQYSGVVVSVKHKLHTSYLVIHCANTTRTFLCAYDIPLQTSERCLASCLCRHSVADTLQSLNHPLSHSCATHTRNNLQLLSRLQDFRRLCLAKFSVVCHTLQPSVKFLQ